MTRTPEITEIIGTALLFDWVEIPSRKRPNIPPLKMEANFHQESKIPLTFIMAIATTIPAIPISMDTI